MNIVYVGDNRNRLNYGCRATSTALSELLSVNNKIVGRIHGNFRNTDTRKIFYSPILGSYIYKFCARRKHWPIFKEVLIDIIHIRRKMKVSFTSNDFISMDFENSINKLLKCLPANDILKECDLRQYDFDALVVNGEGSFIFSQNPWRESLVEAMFMYWAKKMGKKVFFLNGMFSGSPNHELNMSTISLMRPLFETIDLVGVREEQSLAFAKKYFPNATIALYPDALFTWYKYINDGYSINNGKYFIGMTGATDESFVAYNFDQDYICISGSSSEQITKDRKFAIKTYCALICKLQKELKLKVIIVIPCEIDNFLLEVGKITNSPIITVDTPVLAAGKILANARVYITGRYHPSILASLGGTPCVFMNSNSHKNMSLQQTLEYDNPHEYNSIPTEDEINKIIYEAKSLISKGNLLRAKIRNRSVVLSKEAEKMSALF